MFYVFHNFHTLQQTLLMVHADCLLLRTGISCFPVSTFPVFSPLGAFGLQGSAKGAE